MVYLAELSVRITIGFKIVRIYARSVPRIHGHKRLDDDATENVKPHFEALREYVTVQGLKGLKCAIVC